MPDLAVEEVAVIQEVAAVPAALMELAGLAVEAAMADPGLQMLKQQMTMTWLQQVIYKNAS